MDIGDHVVIRGDDIRDLDAHFAQLPVQVIYVLNFNYNTFRTVTVSFIKAMRMKMTGINSFTESASTWLKHVCLKKDFVGFVNSGDGDLVFMTLYDTTVEELDIIINQEMSKLGIVN